MAFHDYILASISTLLFFSCSARADRSFDVTIEDKVESIVSIFENGTPELQYDYIDALPDGRGYTAGRSGFTSGTGDLLEVIHRYESKGPSTSVWPHLSKLIPLLESRAKSHSGLIRGLESLPRLWSDSADDQKFLEAQDEISDELYRSPAREQCNKLGLSSPLAFLVIYDSIIQHGDGDDDDSLDALLRRTPASSDEKTFIRSFLKVRYDDLMNPANHQTADEWRESVGRVEALQKLVDQGKWDLASPLRLDVWKHIYSL